MIFLMNTNFLKYVAKLGYFVTYFLRFDQSICIFDEHLTVVDEQTKICDTRQSLSISFASGPV